MIKPIAAAMLLVAAAIAIGLPALPSHADQGDDLLLLVPSIVAKRVLPSTPIKPGPNNTGFVAGPTIQILNQSFTITVPNTVLSDIDLTGCITVKADNVTIRNVRINCSSFYGIRANEGFKNLVIEDVEIFGSLSSGILGSDFTLRRANIHDSGGDAVKAGSNVLIESSYFHRLGTKAGSHSDGVQMVSGGNVTIRNNTINMPHSLNGYTNSQCMIIQTNNGPIDNITIQDNWLNGGGYCVQINDKGNGHGPPTNVVIRDNKFGPDCQFGILRFAGSSPQLSGNVYELTGIPIGSDFTLCEHEQP